MSDFPRTWGNYKIISDEALRYAAFDLPAATIEKMRVEFERTKAELGWPEDAVPEWSIRWTYTEEQA